MIGKQEFLDLMAGVCAPVSVVTASDGLRPAGATVSSLASLSLEPPLLSIAFARSSALLDVIRRSGKFGVNVLGQRQDSLAITFAGASQDRFTDVNWTLDHGLPRILDAPGWAACELANVVEAGDHLLLIGHVVHVQSFDSAPLVYAHRTFGTHSRYDTRARRPLREHLNAFAR
jgi:flavin reductase (DIM6/NTAB) family NADH-FMN oxidoreductase RutF